jgi:hypothetical protein
MVDIAADSGGAMVYFGGGTTARDELREALDRGVPAVIVDDPSALPGRRFQAEGQTASPGFPAAPALPAGIRRWRRGMDCPMLPA